MENNQPNPKNLIETLHIDQECLKCPICFDIAWNAFETSCCIGLICSRCSNSIKEQICPFCRNKNFGLKPSIIARKVIASIIFPCPCKCGSSFHLSNMKGHILDSHKEQSETNPELIEKLQKEFDIRIFQDRKDYEMNSFLHIHKLIKFPCTGSWICMGSNILPKICDQNNIENKFCYRCLDCNMNYCFTCVKSENVFNVSKHDHILKFVHKDNGWSCDGRNFEKKCLRGITGFFKTNGIMRFRCEECDFDLCDKCLIDNLK